MATIQDVAEQCWLQIFPHGNDESAITKEEVIAATRTLYATQLWVQVRNEKNAEGEYEVPSYLLSEVEKDVVNNQIDVSDLEFLKALPSEIYIQNIGGLTCDCQYIKSTVNRSQLLNEDDTFDNFKTYYLMGKKIYFPRGTHKKRLSIIYANAGENIDGVTEIDEVVAGILRDKVIDTFLPKMGKEDETNNSNSNA